MNPDDLAGMTVNERLHSAGLLDAFDAAVRTRSAGELLRLLREAGMSEKQAAQTISTLLADSSAYGY